MSFALAPKVWASFEEFPTGGRATGLGGAVTAAVDDVFSLYYNPAGAMQVTRTELGTYFGRLHMGLTDGSNISRSFIGLVQPLQRSALGLSYVSLSLSSLYKEETIGLTYARALAARWNAGVSMKYLRKDIGSDTYTDNAINPLTGATLGGPDPLFASGHNKTAYSIDVGMQYRLSRTYALGAALLNANEPNVALGSDPDRVSRIMRVGLARRKDRSMLSVDVSRQRFTEMEHRFHVGGEHWLKMGLGFRAGFGMGPREYRRATAGFSYRWDVAQFDYGFIFPLSGIKGTMGTHQISLTLRFGKERARSSVARYRGKGFRRAAQAKIPITPDSKVNFSNYEQ